MAQHPNHNENSLKNNVINEEDLIHKIPKYAKMIGQIDGATATGWHREQHYFRIAYDKK